MVDRISRLVDEIKTLDVKGEVDTLNDFKVQRWKEMFMDLWRILQTKKTTTIQRSRSKWLKEGGVNTNIFIDALK